MLAPCGGSSKSVSVEIAMLDLMENTRVGSKYGSPVRSVHWIPCVRSPRRSLESVTLSSFTPSQVSHIMPFVSRSLHSSVFCAGSHTQLSV